MAENREQLRRKLVAAKSLLSRYENQITSNLRSSNCSPEQHTQLCAKRDAQQAVFNTLRDAYRRANIAAALRAEGKGERDA